MLMKQLKYTHEDGLDHMDYNANPAEDKTIGPWSFDNIDPRQNIWAIVTTSDTGHVTTSSTRHTLAVVTQDQELGSPSAAPLNALGGNGSEALRASLLAFGSNL